MLSYGAVSEQRAREYLESTGHSILETNFQYYGRGRGRRGEIDIISLKDNIIHFVEVKARKNNSFGHPLSSITPQKVQLLRAAAEFFFLKNKTLKGKFSQFDVVTVRGSDIEFFPRAF